jgi:hypothetical protein
VLGEVLGDSDTVSYPVQQILPDDGHLEWILDQSAAHDFVANRK